jgi:hypothetical protein
MNNIDEICEKYNIKNYTINDDGSIDVNDSVILCQFELTELPLLFNKVTGGFDCNINKLTTLKGSPKWIGGNFGCMYNNLTSLEFGPEYVSGYFTCINNDLSDLVGSPKQVDGNFNCINNGKLTNPKGCSEKIGGLFYCSKTRLGSIFNEVDQHFLYTFNFYKIIKDNTVNLKRLKYVMDLYDKPINLNRIEKYYRIV